MWADAPGNELLPARATGLPKPLVANVSRLSTLDPDALTGRQPPLGPEPAPTASSRSGRRRPGSQGSQPGCVSPGGARCRCRPGRTRGSRDAVARVSRRRGRGEPRYAVRSHPASQSTAPSIGMSRNPEWVPEGSNPVGRQNTCSITMRSSLSRTRGARHQRQTERRIDRRRRRAHSRSAAEGPTKAAYTQLPGRRVCASRAHRGSPSTALSCQDAKRSSPSGPAYPLMVLRIR